MTKLDKVDPALSAPEPTLRDIEETVKKVDIDTVLSSDIPLEAKRSQLQGLINLLDGKDQEALIQHAKSGLEQVVSDIDEPIIPQITS